MGNEVTIPPDPGKYRNVLLYYEASGNAYMYTSDGIPTLLSYTDYLRLLNKPSINGVLLTGDKSLEELGINDATLTIKQGDTTLGTFSANASENVEINIPAGGNTTLKVRMTGYDTEEPWYIDRFRSSFNIGYDDYTRVPNTTYITAKEVPGPTFENEDTGELITLGEIFEALEAGTEVIFDGLPLGWDLVVNSSDEDDEAPWYDPTRINRLSISSAIGDSEGIYTFAGCAPVPMNDMALPLCFFIDKRQYAPEDPEDDPEIVYRLIVQGSLFIQPPA